MCRRSDHRELATADVELVAVVAQVRAQLHRVERENRSLHCENEALREAADSLIHQAPARERFAFIHARRDRFSVKLMQQHGISSVTRRKRRHLTEPDKRAAVVPDLIRREFTAPMPGLKLIGDSSCSRTGEGWRRIQPVDATPRFRRCRWACRRVG
jgi:hypothetical protein